MRPKWKSPGDKEIKMSSRLSDDGFVVSTGSCISTASNVVKSRKMRTPMKNPKLDESLESRPDI